MLSILVVEDNVPVRKGLIYSITHHTPWFDFVGEAVDGIDGKEKILDQRPEIIVTDIRLPGISGLQMIREIQQVYTPQVIVISGYSEFEYAREALTLGAHAYLVKPIDEDELFDSLRRAALKIYDSRNLDSSSFQVDFPPSRGSSGTTAKRNELRTYYANQAIQYIHCHYSESNMNITEIARALNISESYLGRLFKEQTSFTISEYRTNYCITQAAKLLADPTYKIYEIAQLVGISNQRYFSTLFKQKMGVTPMEYRNTVLSNTLNLVEE